jgi:anti-sigma B factor antagonist
MGDVLGIAAHDRGTTLSHRVAGALDLDSAAAVLEGLSCLIERRPVSIEIDLSGLDYIDSVGFSVFVTAHYQCLDAGVALRFVNPSALVTRLLQSNGLDEILQLGESDVLVGA